MTRSSRLKGCGGALTLAGALACGAGAGTGPKSAADGQSPAELSDQDESRCEFEGRVDREVAESVSTGSLQPSIRRVYRVVGAGEQRQRTLVCREVDTNLDGKKDLVRRYSDRGEAIEEQADSDYDGKLDTWIRFAKGRIAQVEIDLDGDGKPDETRFYLRGKLSRVQRDVNRDGKPDVWEIYAGGHLERMGVDVDFDGRVDRWNRDQVTARAKALEASEAEEKGDSDP
jgi:hypothetical protein